MMNISVTGPGNVDLVALVRRAQSDDLEIAREAKLELEQLTHAVRFEGGNVVRSGSVQSR